METFSQLPELTPQCLEQIFGHLSSREVVRVACAQKLWHGLVANDEQLWKHHLAEEVSVHDKRGPNGDIMSTSWQAYVSWRKAFSTEYWPYLNRAFRAWNQIKVWLQEHAPDILATLRPGLSEAEVARVEQQLGFPLAPALKILYRLHDGQALLSDIVLERRILHRLSKLCPEGRAALGSLGDAAVAAAAGAAGTADVAADRAPAGPGDQDLTRSIFCGMFGGYAVYDHRVISRMLPLNRAVLWKAEMKEVAGTGGRGVWLPEDMDRLLPFSCSYMLMDKAIMADAAGGSMAVARVTRDSFELQQAVPAADTPDAPLRWFEEYARRLSSGWYQACILDEQYPRLSRGISLFPMIPPGHQEAVTQGVRVCASVVYVPEIQTQSRHMFAYSIRFSLTEGAPMKRCQLTHRHWIIQPEPGRQEEVEGEGVIGLYPILEPGGPEFVYCSCTQQKAVRGSMCGRFKFVPGSMDRPEGPPFDVVCPTFRLDLPEYAF